MASGVFGVTSTGYNRPTLADLIAQEQAAMLEGFPNLGFAAGSPELAVVEARAKFRYDDWESQECAFNSFDINNQTGCALDVAAQLQGFVRLPGETDDEFKARINGTVSGDGFVTGLETTIGQIADVCRVRVYNNNTGQTDAYTGNPACSYEVVYQGGDPKAIAQAVWPCTTGASNVGTEECRIEDANGICRTVYLTPAVEVPYCARLFVDAYELSGCSNQTFENIQAAALEALTDKSLRIGDPIFAGLISSTIYSQVSGIDITGIEFAPSGIDVDGNCTCENVPDSAWVGAPLRLTHRTIPTFDLNCICIESRNR